MPYGRFKYEKLPKYPHMKPEDVAVWERCLTKHSELFDTVDYDVCVGKGADFLPSGEDTPDGRENRLYQKKIDVVGYRDDSIYLTEIKPIANMRGLGQVIVYHKLYTDGREDLWRIKKVIICGEVENEMLEIFEQHDIIVLEVN